MLQSNLQQSKEGLHKGLIWRTVLDFKYDNTYKNHYVSMQCQAMILLNTAVPGKTSR